MTPLRVALVSGLLASCNAERAPAVSVAPAAPPSAPAASASQADPVDAVSSPAPVDAGPTAEEVCEKARAAFETSVAALFDRCLGKSKKRYGAITIACDIDAAGHIAQTTWTPVTTTGWGEKVAQCIIDAVKAAPFDEPACANRKLEVTREYPHHS